MVLDDDCQMISRDKSGLNFLTFVLQLWENLMQEIDPPGNQGRIYILRRSKLVTIRRLPPNTKLLEVTNIRVYNNATVVMRVRIFNFYE